MADKFKSSYGGGLTGAGGVDWPATSIVAVTPADGTDLAGGPCRGLWVGGAGNIAIQAMDDAGAVTVSSVPAGTLLPIRAIRVFSANTTATSIVALY